MDEQNESGKALPDRAIRGLGLFKNNSLTT